jgi:hypothetical protein
MQHAALFRAKQVRCFPNRYWTDHVVARSHLIPAITSAFVVHHVEAMVEPIPMSDFYVKRPENPEETMDSFFVWQPRRLVESLITERRKEFAVDQHSCSDTGVALLRPPQACLLRGRP